MMSSTLFPNKFVSPAYSAQAQYYYQDARNPKMLRHADRHAPARKLILIPQVNGYNVYKADLHTHTVYSDGHVVPHFRVNEAVRMIYYETDDVQII